MRVLICPDKFAGTLSAVEAAAAVASGWLAAAPDDTVVTRPLADGGPGFVSVLAAAVRGRVLDVPTVDPLGRPVVAQLLLTESGVAYLESAQACGLHLLTVAERDPLRVTSYGVGVLVATAVELGAKEIVIGLGGTATNDAGAGFLAALGAAALDDAGYALPYGGAALLGCASLGGVPRLRDAHLLAATDVDSPLCGPTGTSAVFGPQKGASPDDVVLLDAALARFGAVLATGLPGRPDLTSWPGAGAGGGLGAAIFGCGGGQVSGIGLVRSLTGLDAALDDCDLVITGEGSLDGQSLSGKVVAGVAQAARSRGIPCVVLAGRISVDPDAAEAIGVTASYSLADHFGSVDQALARPAEGLTALATALARAQAG